MPRGRQYYDPEIQANRPVEPPADLARIEFYPELDGNGQIGRWVGRRIDHDGRIVGYTAGNFDHDAELAHAQELWPGLTVFELQDEQSDSTWDGIGPSPRMWQRGIGSPHAEPPDVPDDPEPLVTPVLSDQPQMRGLAAPEIGTYVLLSDVCAWLESWAVGFEADKNPSAAMALREAVDALKGVG